MGCVMDGLPKNCTRVMQAINRDQAESVSIYGLALTPAIMRLMASFQTVNHTRTLRLEEDGSISNTLRSGGKSGHFEGGYEDNYVSFVITKYVVAPGMQLGFEQAPHPQEYVTGFHPDACGAMAEQAQKFANTATKNANNDFRKALTEFDFLLGTHYAGRPLRGWSDALELQNGADVSRAKAAGQLGESGFEPRFQEGKVNNDQTHHFVTYFSGGLNAQDGILKVHKATEPQPADIRLGDAAQAFGHAVRNDPERLRWIGNSIQTRICDTRNRPVLKFQP